MSKRVGIGALALLFLSGVAGVASGASGDDRTVITEATITRMMAEVEAAVEARDVEGATRYIHPDSTIYVDMDPAPNRGEVRLSYRDFILLTRMSFSAMQGLEQQTDLLSMNIDPSGQRAVVEYKTRARVTMMGQTMEDTSISTLTYSVIDGEIWVTEMSDVLVSNSQLSR